MFVLTLNYSIDIIIGNKTEFVLRKYFNVIKQN